MKRVRWAACCAVVGACCVFLSPGLPAEEPEERSAGEKSVLVGDTPVETETAGSRDYCRCIGQIESQTESNIRKALLGPLTSRGLDFVDTPLEEVVALLQDDYGIPVELDHVALDAIGLSPEEPVTAHLHRISLRSAMRLMLKQLGLTYVIANEVLMITAPEEAEAELTTCVYDVRDLLDGDVDKAGKALIDAVASCVATQTWAAHGGGEAEIRLLKPGLLVVSQTQSVHEDVRGLLAAIRELRAEPTAAGAKGGGFFRVEPTGE
jgi:hypothetical protein